MSDQSRTADSRPSSTATTQCLTPFSEHFSKNCSRVHSPRQSSHPNLKGYWEQESYISPLSPRRDLPTCEGFSPMEVVCSCTSFPWVVVGPCSALRVLHTSSTFNSPPLPPPGALFASAFRSPVRLRLQEPQFASAFRSPNSPPPPGAQFASASRSSYPGAPNSPPPPGVLDLTFIVLPPSQGPT